LGVETRPWFRAPYGEISHAQIDLNRTVQRAGYRHIHWHAQAEDWAPGASAEPIASAILAGVRRRWPVPAIVLLHSWPDPTSEALARLITAFASAQATFLTVDQL
jgi:peptidoglycan/xylan/chitin deacetylase (PgdA/CDA1 family)